MRSAVASVTRIHVVPSSEPEAALWRTTAEVAVILRELPWVVVGGQMVILLELERGRLPGRTTRDLDAIIDVKAAPSGTRIAARRLLAAGFTDSAEHPHRFVRGEDVVDVLAPDHLGRRADLATIPPRATIEIAGGQRAVEMSRIVEVEVDDIGPTELRLPSLGGAIALKAIAYGARRAERDLEDLVRLLALVGDVQSLRRELRPIERRLLNSIAALHDMAHPAWRLAADPDDARAALGRLADDGV